MVDGSCGLRLKPIYSLMYFKLSHSCFIKCLLDLSGFFGFAVVCFLLSLYDLTYSTCEANNGNLGHNLLRNGLVPFKAHIVLLRADMCITDALLISVLLCT